MSIKARPIKANVFLNNEYKNILHFKNDEEKQTYFESLEPNFYFYLEAQPEINFNIGDTLLTSVKIDINNLGVSLNTALNYNYLIVKDDSFFKKYYYYFITSSIPLNKNVVNYSLELDIFTTYNLNSDFYIRNALIERAHIDRFTTDSSQESYSFNLSKDSLIQASEELEMNFKNTYPKEKIDPKFERDLCDEDSTYDILKNINGWLVAFTSGETIVNIESGTSVRSSLTLPYAIYVAPLSEIYIITGPAVNDRLSWSSTYLYNKFKEGTKDTEIYGFSVLKYCPLDNYPNNNPNGKIKLFSTDDVFPYLLDFDLNAYNGLFPDNDDASFEFTHNLPATDYLVQFKRIVLSKQKKQNDNPINLNLEESFANAQKTDLKNIEKEPKLLKSPFTKIILKDNDNTGFDFNIFDLESTTLPSNSVNCLEFPNPEGIKNFATISKEDTYTENLYNQKIGLISTNTFNLPVVDDAYLNYIRQNKNSAITGLAIPLASSAMSTALGVATGGLGLVAGAGNAIKQASNVANYIANVDNLKNTPDGIKNAGNDFLHSFTQGNIKNYISINTLKNDDKKIVFDYFYKFGYRIQKYLNVESLFTRYIFNYIKTMEDTKDKISTISAIVLSDKIKTKISSVFENGTTFWEPDSGKILNINYENYEKRLVGGDNND